MKKISLIVFLVLLSTFSSAAITDFYVPSAPPLDSILTIYGLTDTNAEYCSFFIYDSNGFFVYQLSDEPVRNGFFGSSYYKISEGDRMFRGFDYNATAYCNSDVATQSFTVAQRNTIAFPVQQEVDFLTSQGNINPVLFYGGIASLFFLLLLVILFVKRKAEKNVRF